ncbi:hypothetical protein GCM10022408_19570 [Hymenobacter fastidiosus]|uniref:Uncharacterized protein n=1 Tax=Hymenobacter fastidiosus TaxID=486264 RepID=A0ABP7S7J1_9BACT
MAAQKKVMHGPALVMPPYRDAGTVGRHSARGGRQAGIGLKKMLPGAARTQQQEQKQR